MAVIALIIMAVIALIISGAIAVSLLFVGIVISTIKNNKSGTVDRNIVYGTM